jgi:hypothetical protein
MNVRYRVELSQAERDELTAMLSKGKRAARKLKRAQILLAADAGCSDEEIARTVAVDGSTPLPPPLLLGALVRCHPLLGKLLERLCILGKMRQPHSAQHIRCLGELYVVVADDLEAIAPRIAEVEERSRQHLNARRGQRLADGVLVVNHKAEMSTVVWRLFAAFLKRKELVAQINERHFLVFTAQLELEYPRVERQRFLDIAHFERNVIETHDARLFGFRHRILGAVKEGKIGIATSRFQWLSAPAVRHGNNDLYLSKGLGPDHSRQDDAL